MQVRKLRRRFDPEGNESSVREATLRYRAILGKYLTGDLIEDYWHAYRQYHGMWSNERVWMPDRLLRALDAGHAELHGFDPEDGDAQRLRQTLEGVLEAIDAALLSSG